MTRLGRVDWLWSAAVEAMTNAAGVLPEIEDLLRVNTWAHAACDAWFGSWEKVFEVPEEL